MATANRTCTVDGCDRRYLKNGMCNMHWHRWKNTGATDLQPRPSLVDRFWAKVEKSDPEQCWAWTGATTKKGYGKILANGRLIGAHVISYQIHGGQLPPGYEVDHECHNIICVNPKHLRQATRKQNCEYMNGPQIDNVLGVRGVTYDSTRDQYLARVYHNGEYALRKRFDTIAEADAAVRAKRAEVFTFPEVDLAS